jgi:nitrogen fixation protein NifU and related proteins
MIHGQSCQEVSYHYRTMLSSIAADHVQRPRNAGRIEDATHVGLYGSPGDGPYVQLWFVVEDGVIRGAAYETHGCPSSIAAASLLCQIVIGRPIERALLLTSDDLLKIIGGLPEGKEPFATHAVEALKKGLNNESTTVSR